MSKYASHDPKPLVLTPEQVAELAAQVGTGTIGPKGDKGDPGAAGRDGVTPVKGVDYFDGLPSTVPGPPGYTPVKGVDYFDGTRGIDGYTPIKGIDYNDGAPGHDGSDATVTKSAVETVLTGAITTHTHAYEPVNSNIQTHITSAHAPSTAQKNSDITKGEIEAKLTGEIATHTHASSGGSDPWVRVKLASDFVTSLATNTIVTGFAFTPAINKTYLIFGYFLLRTATATIGARPGVAWPANLTDSTMRVEAANSLTTSGLQLFGARTTKNAASTGLATTADSHWGSLDGIMITSGTTSGTFQITLASETAGTNVTMKAGSILMYREL
jgi:hypothetical protein